MVTQFVFRLLAGITLMWLLMPRKDVTDGFFRIQMLVSLGLSVLAFVSVDESTFLSDIKVEADEGLVLRVERAVTVLKGAMLISGFASYAGHIVWKLSRRTIGNALIFLVGGLSLLSLAIQGVTTIRNVPAWHQLASEATSAMVLGATITGMLLGHWYLTTPTMSIQPLKWFAMVLGISAGLRSVPTAVSMIQYGWSFPDLTLKLWLGVRIAGGIVVPAVTSILVFRILKYRNTQSATGVLFAALILVFMGEMSAALIERVLLIPY